MKKNDWQTEDDWGGEYDEYPVAPSLSVVLATIIVGFVFAVLLLKNWPT